MIRSVTLITLTLLAGPARAERATDALHDVVTEALPRVVKLYGASVGQSEWFGSGVLVSSDGQVVTMLSVMLDADRLRGVTADGTAYPARVVRRDEARQLALVQLDLAAVHATQPPSLPYFAPVSSDAVQPGDWVTVVANPFRVAEGDELLSVMLGTLSTKTKLDARRYTQDIRYDGPVLVVDAITSNPGSSGGALLTLDGRWIGLLGRIATSNLTGTRLNYAIPGEEVDAFLRGVPTIRSVQTVEPIEPGYHGIKLFKFGFRRKLVYVDRVAGNSPASRAGLRRDDLIVTIDGKPIRRVREFHEIMNRHGPGEVVTLDIKRGKKLITAKLTLDEPR